MRLGIGQTRPTDKHGFVSRQGAGRVATHEQAHGLGEGGGGIVRVHTANISPPLPLGAPR